jgi:L-malate glycosyltransferase
MSIWVGPHTGSLESSDVTPTEKSGGANLRLLLVVDSHFPGNGGTEAQAQLLAELLQARGHHVEILAPRMDRSRPEREEIRGVPVRRMNYPHIRIAGGLLLLMRFAWWLYRHRANYDAVHIHMARNLAAGAGMVQPYLGIPVMVKISGAWEFDGGVLDPALRRHPLMAFLNRCIRRLAFVQAISRQTADRLRLAGYEESRIKTIPNAVHVALYDAERRRSPVKVQELRVIYVGRLQPVKGVRVLVEAWPQVRASTGARLLLVGDGPLRPELERRAAELGISDSVEFTGRSNSVPQLLQSADIYVQPSEQEGLPNSVLEAMSAGLPIVATNVGGNVDLVDDGVNGFLVPPSDPLALAAGILKLAGHADMRFEMGRISRQRIDREYAAPAVLDRLEQVYRSARKARGVA